MICDFVDVNESLDNANRNRTTRKMLQCPEWKGKKNSIKKLKPFCCVGLHWTCVGFIVVLIALSSKYLFSISRKMKMVKLPPGPEMFIIFVCFAGANSFMLFVVRGFKCFFMSFNSIWTNNTPLSHLKVLSSRYNGSIAVLTWEFQVEFTGKSTQPLINISFSNVFAKSIELKVGAGNVYNRILIQVPIYRGLIRCIRQFFHLFGKVFMFSRSECGLMSFKWNNRVFQMKEHYFK